MERLRKAQQGTVRPLTTAAARVAASAGGSLVRLGFVPLNDCAPLVVAQEMGFFAKHGLRVRLSRELGWASVRDKLAYGELDAAHAPCGLPFALQFGIGGLRADCCTGLVLNLHGNAITLSQRLWDEGVRDVNGLADRLRRRRGAPLVLGAVSRHSTHARLLQGWLASAGLREGDDIRIVIVPPAQMWANLRGGHLDGYCVGEPWNSAAILAGDGWCATTSCSLAPRHPEKVLAARGAWASSQPEVHERVVSALWEACRLCDDPARRDDVVGLLSRPEYLNLPPALLRPAWGGEFPMTRTESRRLPEFTCFHRFDANEPGPEKAAWVVRELFAGNFPVTPTPSVLASVFRLDVFEAARRRASSSFNPSNSAETDHEARTLPA
jgi:ABC-type nitrate/sulfonate/bicarbonate transport system substrate-binding protein